MKKLAIALVAVLALLTIVSCGKSSSDESSSVYVSNHPLLKDFVESDEYDSKLLNSTNSTVTSAYLAHAVLNDWNENAVEVAMETGTVRYYSMCATGHSNGGKWGDSALIVFPNGQTMLIDAGMAGFGPHLTRNLVKLGITKIDYLIISHMHDDHAYGVLGDSTFLDNIEVGVCYWNGCLSASWSDPYKCENTMKRYNIPCEIVSAGYEWYIGDAWCRILAPTSDWVGKTYTGDEAVNGTSLVLRIDYKDVSILTAGDCYKIRESELVEELGASGLLDVDILKLNHHGNQAASSADWIEATTPVVAVATGSGSVDTAAYGRLAKVGAYCFMDAIDGYVRIVTDGTDISWDTSREREISTYLGYDKVRDSVLAAAAGTN